MENIRYTANADRAAIDKLQGIAEPWKLVHNKGGHGRFHTYVVRETRGGYEYLQTDGTVGSNVMACWFHSVEHADQVIAEYESNKEQHNDRIK